MTTWSEDEDIFEIEWTTRAEGIFRREGIKTVRDLVALSRADLRRFENMGKKTIVEIEVTLGAQGLRLSGNTAIRGRPRLADGGGRRVAMTISEFNAWLDGFEAAFDGAPTKAQWLDIRAKFSEVVRDERWPLYTAPSLPLNPPIIRQPWMTTWSADQCQST